MKCEWVLSIRDQCADAGVPLFFKQWGGLHKKRAGRMLAQSRKLWRPPRRAPARCRAPRRCRGRLRTGSGDFGPPISTAVPCDQENPLGG